MSRVLVAKFNDTQVANAVMPAASKAMLRSPEKVLIGLRAFLSATPVDLSQYSADLCKQLIRVFSA